MPTDLDDLNIAPNEGEPAIDLVFASGRPGKPDGLRIPPSAYIVLRAHSPDTGGGAGIVMLTTREMSIEALADQVQAIKAHLDDRIGEARAQFAAASQDLTG